MATSKARTQGHLDEQARRAREAEAKAEARKELVAGTRARMVEMRKKAEQAKRDRVERAKARASAAKD